MACQRVCKQGRDYKLALRYLYESRCIKTLALFCSITVAFKEQVLQNFTRNGLSSQGNFSGCQLSRKTCF